MNLSLKKILIIAAILSVLTVTLVLVLVKEKTITEEKQDIVIKLIGTPNVDLFMYEDYVEFGAKVFIDGEETDYEVEISGAVDNEVPGKYRIIYKYKSIEEVRTITVIDNIPPVITLKGSLSIRIADGDIFVEPGFSAIDNIDGDITDKVVVSGEVGKGVGTYILTYEVSDNAGNIAYAEREITVVRRLAVRHVPSEPRQPVREIQSNNEITSIIYINNGIRVSGVHSQEVDSLSVVNQMGVPVNTVNTVRSGNSYRADIPLNTLANGDYFLYINMGETRERAANRLDETLRVRRAKKGNNTVSFNYSNNNVRISVVPHQYIYDILIDVGHGGTEPGAVNSTHRESELNLIVSQYEARRFREHGLRVRLNRNGNEHEMRMGPSEWVNLRRVAYGMGYHGVTARIVYSNHHNSTADSRRNGPEVIVAASLTAGQLSSELRIINQWMAMTPNLTTGLRFYTRNYETGTFHTKFNNQVYSFRNWYAITRIPYELFNVHLTTFEPAFMSNPANFRWYWIEENWIHMSEFKIRTYVEQLGITYVPPN